MPNQTILQNTVLTRITIIGVILLLFFILLPSIFLWFFKLDTVTTIFEENDPKVYWTERYPFPLLLLLILFLLYITVFHLAIFLQSILPVFGTLIFGRQATYIIAGCIVTLVILMIGLIQTERWAWWGSLLFFSGLILSALTTFWQMQVSDIIHLLDLPAYEIELLEPMTILQDLAIIPWLLIPMLTTLGLLLYSKRFFKP